MSSYSQVCVGKLPVTGCRVYSLDFGLFATASVWSLCNLLVNVTGVDGDFDFCQLAVKRLLTDHRFHSELLEKYNTKLRHVIS